MFEGVKKALSTLAEKIRTTYLSEKEIDEKLETLFYQLVTNDVAFETAEKIREMLKNELKTLQLPRFEKERGLVDKKIREVISSIIAEGGVEEIIERIKEKSRDGKVTVILFVGPNGSGKTTTVVKVANYLKKHGFSSIIACADTFRAGAIEQLKQLAGRYNFWVVSQSYGADPAAVAVDAIKSAEANKIPVVLIDTAGRTEVDKALLEEMRKIKRVTRPDFVI